MDNTDYKILIVDDEPDIVEFITYNLSKAGYKVYTSESGKDAIQLSKRIKPHLILLDVMMPEMDGIETCENLRNDPSLDQTVIAFLTARAEDYSQVAGFDAGADDYINKPIKPKVLLSRIKALLKRYGHVNTRSISDNGSVLKRSDLEIDRDRFVVKINNSELNLPKKEFELLNLLISKPEKVFSREEIFQSVWGENIIVGDRTIDVHVRKLREKLGNKYIKTVKGVGYKFVG
jgi:two-component system alkaline phosphatase synthesis response regulator PhoP